MAGTSEATKYSSFPNPMTTGGPIAGGYDLVRLIGGNHCQGKDSTHLEHRLANGFFQRNLRAIAAGQVLLDEVGEDLGVGLGQELMALFAQLLFQAEVVLDDAVMHHHDAPGAIAMRMGILLRRPAMGCPAGVADAVSAVDRIQPDSLFQVAQLAFGAADLQPVAIAGDRDSRRIIAAILEPFQAIENDWNNPLFTDVTNNSAHVLTLQFLFIDPAESKAARERAKQTLSHRRGA